MTKLLINFTRKIVYLLWFFVTHASLGILTLEGQPPPRHLRTDSVGTQFEGGMVGAAPQESKCRGLYTC